MKESLDKSTNLYAGNSMYSKAVRDSKEYYDEIQIPEELNEVVQKAINTSRATKMNVRRRDRRRNVLKYTLRAAAAVVLMFIAGLNTSKSFADEIHDLPVIGSLAKVLTIRSYDSHEDGKNIVVNVPEIQVDGSYAQGEETEKFVGDINEEIQKIIDEYVADAQKNFDEYKEAFLATGGTEEEWADRDIDINVGYEIKYQDDRIVSFVLTGYESWVNYSQKQVFYNLDLESNQYISLKDRLGENWVELANKQIVAEIERRVNDEGCIFWGYGDNKDTAFEGFQSVDEETDFYINESGNVVIVFEKYSIGPGSTGIQEFEILAE